MTRNLISLLAVGGLIALNGCEEITDNPSTDDIPETGETGDTNTPEECSVDDALTAAGTARPSEADFSECAAYTGETLLYWGRSRCVDGTWYHEAETAGWTSGGQVHVIETADTNDNRWSETHSVSSNDHDANGYWDYLVRSLVSVYPDFGSQVDDTNTLFDCDWDATGSKSNRLTFAMVIYDPNDPTVVVDCGKWGHDTEHADILAVTPSDCLTFNM